MYVKRSEAAKKQRLFFLNKKQKIFSVFWVAGRGDNDPIHLFESLAGVAVLPVQKISIENL